MKNKLKTPEHILSEWNRMENFGLSLNAHSVPKGEGVWIITAHQSKGLEYEIVFMPNSIEGVWSNAKNHSKLQLPASITGDKLEKVDINEEERRLYFVAMTRARDALQISFPESDTGRPKLPALFTTELGLIPHRRETLMNPEYFLESYQTSLYALRLEQSDRAFIQNFFAHYSLSPTDLSRFLKSPEEFLQRSILRYPFEDTLKTLFGTCYHSALEIFYKTWKLEKSRPELALLEDTFRQKIGRFRLSELEQADALER
jgi:DNA helicase II / ATP-dependent DNA helicase PcrA